jgi:hypothetical protein
MLSKGGEEYPKNGKNREGKLDWSHILLRNYPLKYFIEN